MEKVPKMRFLAKIPTIWPLRRRGGKTRVRDELERPQGYQKIPFFEENPAVMILSPINQPFKVKKIILVLKIQVLQVSYMNFSDVFSNFYPTFPDVLRLKNK